jgi:glycogen debranching enzyme
MFKLKEGDAYIVADTSGEILGPGTGFFQRDTRWLSKWQWVLGDVMCLASQAQANTLFQYFALADAHKTQIIGIERQVEVTNNGFHDRLCMTNTSLQPQTLTLGLLVEPDFRDVFTIWAKKELDPAFPIVRRTTSTGLSFERQARDDVKSRLEISFSRPGDSLDWTLHLAPGETIELLATIDLSHAGLAREDESSDFALPVREDFKRRDNLVFENQDWQKAYEQANRDLRTLLLPTEFGPYPAAGLPNFVNFFGRDALITSMMVGPQHKDISRAILLFLAHHQGRVVDPFREEEPGKILHEIRRGELSRSGTIPFGRYYGSVDSTALYLMALGQYVEETGDHPLASAIADNWQAALDWLVNCQTEEGLVAFAPSGSGLTVQSWKDSHDSMNHKDGTAAEAPLAVAEVQGYAYAAFMAAGRLFDLRDDKARAENCRARAERLAATFHRLFWLEELETYAMALDKTGAPLAVKSSDPGHLLWCGIVPEAIAPRLVATLMKPDCWSGWGLRTLGTSEVRYNPVSYHNGSVWPHDTALFGAGLARYGFKHELGVVTEALFALACRMPGQSLPELVCGFPRVPDRPPIAYTHACSPQSWAAAGLLMLGRLASSH